MAILEAEKGRWVTIRGNAVKIDDDGTVLTGALKGTKLGKAKGGAEAADTGGDDQWLSKQDKSQLDYWEKHKTLPPEKLAHAKDVMVKRGKERMELERSERSTPERDKVNAKVFDRLLADYGEPAISDRSSAKYFRTNDGFSIRMADHPPHYGRSNTHISVVTSGTADQSQYHPETIVVTTYKKTPTQVKSEVDIGLKAWRDRKKTESIPSIRESRNLRESLSTLDAIRNAGEADLERRLEKLDRRHRALLRVEIERAGRVQDVPQAVWDQIQRDIEEETTAAILLLILAADEWTTDAIGDLDIETSSRTLRQDSVYSLAAARQTMTTAAETIETLRDRLARKIEDAKATGPGAVGELTTEGIDGAIDEVLTTERRKGIATDMTTGSLSLGQRGGKARTAGDDGAAETTDGQRVRVELRWVTERDNRVCPRCSPLDGTYEDVWGLVFPNGPGPEAHPNCILPGNLICVPGLMPAATDSTYIGWCIEAICQSGRRLTVTEDHKILTGRSWLRASQIIKGDDVFSSTDPERIAAFVDPDNDHCPSLVEEIFASSVVADGVAADAMPIASEDFNGNFRRLNRKVDIVNANRLLPNRINPTLVENRSNLYLKRRNLTGALLADSNAEAMNVGLLDAACCSMCGCDLTQSSSFTHRGPLKILGFGLIAGHNSKIGKSATQGLTRDSDFKRQSIFGFPGKIPNGQFLDTANTQSQRHGYAGSTLLGVPDVHSMTTEQRDDTRAGNTNLAGQFLRRFASLIALDQIVSVRRFKYSGHVYDLQSDPWRLLFCNGIVVHNCRCSLSPTAIVTAQESFREHQGPGPHDSGSSQDVHGSGGGKSWLGEVTIGSREVKTFINPSLGQIQGFLAKHKELRALIDYDAGDIYVWPAFDATHTDFAAVFGIKVPEYASLPYFRDPKRIEKNWTIMQSLAKKAKRGQLAAAESTETLRDAGSPLPFREIQHSPDIREGQA